MPPLALTLDAVVQSPTEPGYFHRYEVDELVRSFNANADGVSNQAFWWPRGSHTLMLKPEVFNPAFLNSATQLPYVIRLADFTVAASNLTNTRVFEASLQQNTNNPFIHHTPISPTLTAFVNSPEQIPGITNIDTVSTYAGSVTGAPTAGPAFPGVSTSDVKAICWTKAALPANMPLYFRWHVSSAPAGHMQFYDFYVGQFCIRCGAAVVEVFRDVSPSGDRSSWQSISRAVLFGMGPLQATGQFGSTSAAQAGEYESQLRSLLWVPFRRNFIYLESSYGAYAVVQANNFTQTNEMAGAARDWNIVQPRNLVVAALTPGPGYFQVQKVKFPDGPASFTLPPFTTDYAPAAAPSANWIVVERDQPDGASISFTTPSATYTFTPPTIDHHPPTAVDPALSDQSRTFSSTFTFLPGTDPTNGSLKTYSPMLYAAQVQIPNVQAPWPVTAKTITDSSPFPIAAPAAWIKRAEITADIGNPGRIELELEDLGASLASYYSRADFPLQLVDQTGPVTLWSGIANPMAARETRLDTAAPREIHLPGQDYWKWLTEAPMRDNRDWSGVGHITVIQSVLQQAGVSIANWDGPAPGTYTPGLGGTTATFKMDAQGYDTPLSGPPALPNDASTADGTTIVPPGGVPVRSPWKAWESPPDSYGSYIKRIADVWSGWDLGSHPDGSFYYHPFDYYTASEVTFHSKKSSGSPWYLRGSVQYEPLMPDANVVVCVAAAAGGALLYSTPFVDKGSLLPKADGSLAVNFIGKERLLVVALPGWMPWEALNACARAIFARARRRRWRVHFRGIYTPALKLGHCHTLEGISGVWRLQSVHATYERPGWDTADYVSELVEKGF